jgi:hypothetical protein
VFEHNFENVRTASADLHLGSDAEFIGFFDAKRQGVLGIRDVVCMIQRLIAVRSHPSISGHVRAAATKRGCVPRSWLTV